MNFEKLINESEKECSNVFSKIEDITLYNQEKVLRAFQNNKIAQRHFAPTTGYGYDDVGKNTLCKIFAEVFCSERALVSPQIASGTHAIAAVLFGILKPTDTLLSINGDPYDTLMPVIMGDNIGSLKDYGVNYRSVPLKNNSFDYDGIKKALELDASVILLQRSGGYNFREAFSIEEIENVISFIKSIKNIPVIVDNCYGEFTDKREPIEVGASIIIGSLIKNPGGGLAPTGGYICGTSKLLDKIGARLTAPGIGFEVGSYSYGYQYFYQGLFMAPHTVEQAMKSSLLFGKTFEKLGYNTLPYTTHKGNDIIRSIVFRSKEDLVTFCQAIQQCSPVDSHVVPIPWDMPGYNHQIIMAAGAFIQGASIELSADSPIKEPFTAYLQGALTYEHAKIALKECLKILFTSNNKIS